MEENLLKGGLLLAKIGKAMFEMAKLLHLAQ